ncbi:hypothetical protein VTG60DRAFT_4619 [Thermothelomyces hinnuleus]
MEQDDQQQDGGSRRVFTKPRSWRRLGGSVAHEDRNPWPRWATIPSRGPMCALEIGVGAYVGRYHQKKYSQLHRTDALIALGAVIFAAVMDGFITIASVLGYYEAIGVCFSAAVDLVPAALCCVGALSIAWPERRPDDPLNGAQDVSATLVAVVW